MKRPIIQIQNLVKEFPAGDTTIRVLHGIDLTLYQGEMVAIIGQSGSGKSTLMNILGCLDKATSGSYHVFKRSVDTLDVDELAKLRREHFGFIFQRYHLLGDISALDNVAVPAVYSGVPAYERYNRATQLLTNLGLGDKTTNKPNQLSGGQQQRVSIARALMNGGDIILADEPTGALDSSSGADVMQILYDLRDSGHTIIMVTHDPNLARKAQRVIEIKDGYIIEDYYTNENTTNATIRPQDLKAEKTAFHHTQSNSQKLNNNSNDIISDTKNISHKGFRAFIDRLLEAFKMSVFAMTAHKMRTLLTMLGIIIGIASVVSIVGLGKGSQQIILNDISALGTSTITVRDGYQWGDPRRAYHKDNLTIDDANAVAEQPYVESVSPQVDTSMRVRYRDIDNSANINGVGKDYLEVTGEKLAQGQMFSTESVNSSAQDIIIDHNTLKTFFPNIKNPIGEVLLVGRVPGRVIGVLEESNNNLVQGTDTPQIYIPYTTVMYRMLGKNTLDRFVVLINSNVPSTTAETNISDLLKSRHGTDDFRLQNFDSIRETVESTTTAMTLLISSIAIISLVVGGIGVMNIMLVSVTERTGEIGVRMAVGARQSDIMQQFLIEAILVCLLGGALGVALAFMIGYLINSLDSESFRVVYSTTSIVAALSCSTMIGIIFGFLPAKNAARLDPVVALSRD